MAAEEGLGRGRDGLVRLSPILVLDATGAPEPGDVASSRAGKIGKRWRFIVEFVAEQFADPRRAAEVSASIEPSAQVALAFPIYRYPERRSIRVVFDLDPGSEPFCELRVVLKAADQPASETWLYRWTA